ncbi:MAG: lysylphosphatidylglycerol synthase transmembrane domain-containing protein [Candidatus Promineifilaceae bacterium]
MNGRLATLLKVAVTVLGLAYVIWEVPLDEVGAALSEVHWGWLVVCLGLIVLSLAPRAYRWLLLLRGLGVEIGFGRLLRLYFVGNFFNALLPSGFGGDAVRILEVAKQAPRSVAAGTVIVDRLTGLMMLFVMALLALPFRPASFPDQLAYLVAIVGLIGLVAGIVLLDGRLLRRLGSELPAGPKFGQPQGVASRMARLGRSLDRLLAAIQGAGPRAVLGALAVSLLFNLILISYWAIGGMALGLEVAAGYYLLLVPILSMTLLVPSVGGLGVRESVAPLLFASAGVSSAEAVALALLISVLMRLSSLLGAPLYLASLRRPVNSARQASAGNSGV